MAFTAYAFTAARTITWWDGSSYALAAFTLGIPGAQGSLLLTILGWLATRVRFVDPVAFQLNLLAALFAALLVGLATWIAIRLSTPEDRSPCVAEWAAGLVAGLTLAFGLTVWTYAVQFTPYILTALFTALILISALSWWRHATISDEPRRLFMLFLLFGLDFSVHRTNALLLPAALVWVALRRPTAWLWPYTRLESLAFRVIPTADPGVWDVDMLRRKLTKRTRYSDLADSTIAMNSDDRALAGNYFFVLFTLADAELRRGDPAACLETLQFQEERVPLTRLGQGDLTEALRAEAHARLVGIPSP